LKDLAEPWLPLRAAILADLGAEVIKVEPPKGDPAIDLKNAAARAALARAKAVFAS
jgi:crotonobetainyl-CoA:carnitine CoA-transferase CaiB-like acyl-CoA transferase